MDKDAHIRCQLDDQIARLTAEYLALGDRLHQLKVSRNAHTLAGRLPAELWTQIFWLVQPGRHGDLKRRRLLKMTWVCQFWRDAALGCAGLWADIDTENWKWSQECVERSKSVPLTMRLHFSDRRDCAAHPSSLLYEIPRVRILHIHKEESSRVDLPYGIWNRPAPLLESFTAFGIQLPDNLFGGIAPMLQDLHIQCSSFSWDAAIFSNLTSLTIAHPPSKISLDVLLKGLTGIPALEVLRTDELIALPVPTTNLTPVSFTALRSLTLMESATSAITTLFLKLVSFADTTSIAVCAASNLWTLAEYMGLIDQLEGLYTSPRVIDSLSISEFWIQPSVSMSYKPVAPSMPNQGSISLGRPRNITIPFLFFFLHDKLRHLRHLTINADEDIPTSMWTMASHLESLEEIHLLRQEPSNSFLLNLIAQHPRDLPSDTERNLLLPFPALQILEIDCDSAENTEIDFNNILDILLCRKACRRGLKELIFSGYYGSSQKKVAGLVRCAVDIFGRGQDSDDEYDNDDSDDE
ncbi:hypothetical protein BDN72DRAFT_964650 [Pluteus cervinus]|uniref:Uncharacterized protein n=1 Tax=Pluteus cervinus TaxID=181527 RepID=A0ACD3A9F6_9AGAR|nr:hypothetical protein BDN72DRAFT_964650 [Pluteus cervinus]